MNGVTNKHKLNNNFEKIAFISNWEIIYSFVLDVNDFEKFQLCGLVTSELSGENIQNFTEKL
jgi:hypothetical protein